MGKGYNNYMCKKPFHPGSKANIKRAWMAEQKTENEKKKQEDLKTQYEKEQDLYNNRALISSESKDKLELNFMYEAPPGAKRERQKEDDEPEYKFEWQRKYNAPREDYARGNEDIKDQPFGIPVRNVRCIKCHKWGHINTDRECPLFMQASASSMPTTSMDPMELMRQMREDGYGLKENVLGHHLNPKAANQQLIPSEESDPETEFLKSLSTAEKKKLLRKLKKLSKKQEKSKKKKSKKSKKSKSKDSSESESEKDTKRKKKTTKQKASTSSSESSSDESVDVKEKKNKRKRNKSPSRDEEKKHVSKVKTYKEISKESSISIEPKKKKHHKEYNESEHSMKPNSEKKATEKDYTKKSKDREKKSKNEESSIGKKRSRKDLSNRESMKVHNENVIQSNWKSSYSSSSSDNEEMAATCSEEGTSSKRKAEENSPNRVNVKKIKVEKGDSDVMGSQKLCSSKHEHPDGFSHAFPQAKVAYNYLVAEEEYKGKMHDEFRHHYRENRSPSVKQKYNK